MTLRIGIFGTQLSQGLSADVGLYTVLGFAAAIGAMTYGILIRLLGFYKLTAGSLATISLSCVLASFLGLFTLGHFHLLGPWWLAVLWWYAFSSSLWYCSRRQNAANQGLSGERTCSGRTPRPRI